jgi:hypothetical protein
MALEQELDDIYLANRACRHMVIPVQFGTDAVCPKEYAPCMQVHKRPQLVVTQSGNGEERAAQIDRILDRMDRLRHYSEHMISELAEVTREMELCSHKRPPVATVPAKPSN